MNNGCNLRRNFRAYNWDSISSATRVPAHCGLISAIAMSVRLLAQLTAMTAVGMALGDDTDYCSMLEQETVGRFAPFLSGLHGSFYVAGQALPPSTDHDQRWPVLENETVGFTHAFFRDGRARGEGIVTDRITGTGHSMWYVSSHQ